MQQGKLYEVYARYISEENLVGFLEIEELVFSESPSAVLVDPGEEKLKLEFKGVQRSYIPIHLVSRIDEMAHEGPARILEIKEKGSNVSHFPSQYYTPSDR